ncbi:Uma2 family endonuclease [Actinomadura gamaensis]|uniref:Uma2 family endonuclease n=1 Tax=Actinomadura gamaensis TaxID=1763541 RepID=A0ABV9TQR4_9ACTN
MREESPQVSVMAVVHRHQPLPADPYELWLRDELGDLLGIPHDGTRVEIVGGEIVVSPGPDFAHNLIVSDLQDAFAAAKAVGQAAGWRCVQTQDVNLSEIHEGYIPDLCVMSEADVQKARSRRSSKILPDELTLAVEVTSRSNFAEDREPGARRQRPSKWNGYARTGIPYYLIVDRDPQVMTSTLFTEPGFGGRYEESTSWKFGESIQLPAPFGITVPTDEWEAWD